MTEDAWLTHDLYRYLDGETAEEREEREADQERYAELFAIDNMEHDQC